MTEREKSGHRKRKRAKLQQVAQTRKEASRCQIDFREGVARLSKSQAKPPNQKTAD
ncbi:hypothetical protein ABIE62_001291 [Porphyrobacter sp. MBR-155]|uniref:hypothetical protein n=1 Tax=Porphyrobacter sp. MBR-155 TaxID=3156464 RepID=UPI0033983D94